MIIRNKYLIFILFSQICFYFPFTADAQIIKDSAAHYGKDFRSLNYFIIQNIVSVIQEMNCRTEDSLLLSTFTAILTISQSGKIESVAFPNLSISPLCKEKLVEEFMKMEGWVPETKNGKKVKSNCPFYVSCIRWEEN